MKNLSLNIYRIVVGIIGTECGFTGEGNEQWYYSLSLVINLMLIWWLKPEIGLLFTILAIIHYVTVFIYGCFDLYDSSTIFAYAYFGIHWGLFVIALFTNFKWAMITMIITTVAYLLAPDCTGNNIFLRKKSYSKLSLLFNAIMFATFVIITVLLPIKIWIKLLLIISALVLHPIIDYLEGEGVLISDVTHEVFDKIKSSIEPPKKR